jgi:hypothetical protein
MWFLNANDLTAAEIHRHLCGVYGPSVMSEAQVLQRVRHLKHGRRKVHDGDRNGRPSVVNDEIVGKVSTKVVKIYL